VAADPIFLSACTKFPVLVTPQDVAALLACLKAQGAPPGQQHQDLADVVHPRTARVNALKVSVQQVLRQLKQEGKAGGVAAELAKMVKVRCSLGYSVVFLQLQAVRRLGWFLMLSPAPTSCPRYELFSNKCSAISMCIFCLG
jgi:hypothetical protein